MDELSDFERAVLEKLLAGCDPALAVLRAQAQVARLVERTYTGSGFFLSFDVPSTAPVLPASNFAFGDVFAAIDGLQYGAGFVVFVRGGFLETLEGYSFEETWPEEIRAFQLSYEREPRHLSLPVPE